MRQLRCLLVSLAGAAVLGDRLWGLEMVRNSPEEPALATIDSSSGAVTIVGPALGNSSWPELAATGDLASVDSARRRYLYLGDTEDGTTLIGLYLDAKTGPIGTVACETFIPVLELGFVGFGQSLNFDAATDTLIISGIVVNATTNVTSHLVLRGPAAACGPFVEIGRFGDADYVPMLHASAYDPAAQRLFVGLATSASGFAVGVIDLASGTMVRVDAESATNGDLLVGMKWHAQSATLVGVASTSDYLGLDLVQLDPMSGKWTLTPVVTDYPVVLGNAGSVSALDAATGRLFYLAAANTTTPDTRIVTLDVASATVLAAPSMSVVGLNLLFNLVFPGET